MKVMRRVSTKMLHSSLDYPINLYSFDINPSEIEVEIPEDHELGSLVVIPEMEEFVDMEMVNKFPIQSMFTSDEDVFSLQEHRANNDFKIEFEEIFESYVEGDWEFVLKQIEKCLKIDPEDGP